MVSSRSRTPLAYRWGARKAAPGWREGWSALGREATAAQHHQRPEQCL